VTGGIEIGVAILAGLLIGSFLNMCVYRLPRDLSIAKPARSFCPACEKTIAWYDNIPVVSYLMLRGRCRACGAPISMRYPIVELSTALAFALCVATLGWSLLALKFSIFFAILITLIATDIEERILPDEFTLGGLAIGLIFAPFVHLEPGLSALLAAVMPRPLPAAWVSLIEAALGAGITSGVFWLFGWAFEKVRHREGLGLGDVKMIAMIGAFLGLRLTLLTMFVASLAGSVIGLIYIYATRRKASEYGLPFGSFIGAAAVIVALVMQVLAELLPKK
jgi:leader peptidase (prepilin peptidase) / N-methyltransferase